MTDLPLISVIMPCLNRAKYVAEAVESVRAQNYPHVELVAADGGSTDGTLDILARYPWVQVHSERDRSLYDALNKALARSKGSVIAHLNTDDLFPEGTFRAVGDAFAADPDLDCVYGGSAVFKDGPPPRPLVKTDNDFARLRFAARTGAFTSMGINARFFHRRVYETVGPYDAGYRIAGDREFFLRAVFAGGVRKAAYLDRLLFLYRHHAGSLTFNDDAFSAALVGENLRMAEDLAAAHGRRVTAGDRAVLRAWHTEESLRLANWHGRHRRWKPALAAAARGWGYDPAFPVAFGLAAIRKAFGFRRPA